MIGGEAGFGNALDASEVGVGSSGAGLWFEPPFVEIGWLAPMVGDGLLPSCAVGALTGVGSALLPPGVDAGLLSTGLGPASAVVGAGSAAVGEGFTVSWGGEGGST